MTHWKCPICAGEKETKDNVVITICPACLVAMKKIGYFHKRIVEVKNGYRNKI